MAETVKERKNLESVMRSDPELNEILSQLVEQSSEDLVQVILTFRFTDKIVDFKLRMNSSLQAITNFRIDKLTSLKNVEKLVKIILG